MVGGVERVSLVEGRGRPERADTTGTDTPTASVDAADAYLALAVTETRMSAGIVSTDGEVLVRDRVATPQRQPWPVLSALVQRVQAAARVDVRPVRCGVSAPGPIDRRAGRTSALARTTWRRAELRERLSEALGVPVDLESPGRAFALAERWLGTGPDDQFVAIVLGDDVDAGIVADGRLLDGGHGTAGWIGHIVVEPDGRACRCGGNGCLEAYAGARSIEADTTRTLQRTPPAIVERTAIMVGRAIASLAAMIDVRTFVVSGPVVDAFGGPLFTAMAHELEQRSRLPHLVPLVVTPALGVTGSPLVAAAAVARRGAELDAADQPADAPEVPEATSAGTGGVDASGTGSSAPTGG